MVELASYSSGDWFDSVVNRAKAESLKSKSPRAILCYCHFCLMGRDGKIHSAMIPLIVCSILSILGITASSSVGAKGTGTPGFPRRIGGAFK
jgi:hypothetical protein